MRSLLPAACLCLLWFAPAWAQESNKDSSKESDKAPIRLDVVDFALPKSLTGAAGNADAGRKVFLTRTLGNCLACHQVSSLKSEEFHGEFGPSLDGVASRYNEAQ